MTLTVKELEKDVLDYLESTIKNTPQDFKDLVDCMLLIKDKCGINLAMLASLSFNAWGEFNGVDIRLAECPSSRHTAEGEKIIATAENVSYYKKNDIDECICDYIIAKYPFFDEDSDNYDETTEDLYEELCYLIEDNYPLDVFALVESYGIKIISYSELCLKQNISFKEILDSFSAFGFLCRDKNSSKAIIYYNDHNSLATNNFTLLHELGHYLMNHFEDNRDNDNLANCFARNLIAPASVCQKLKFEDPYSLSEYFQISLSAAHTRLDFIQRDLYHINQLGKHPMFYYKPLLYAQ